MKLFCRWMVLGASFGFWMSPAIAQPTTPPVVLTVNSTTDGPPQADAELTLREAIAITNGTLPLAALSVAERAQVSPATDGHQIHFDLPPGDTTIQLTATLPPLIADGVTLDGTTQPGYGDALPYLPDSPIPLVTLTPAPGVEVFRGLTLAGHGITVRGLALYGFWSSARATLTTPAADIFIAGAPPPADAGPGTPPVDTFDLADPVNAAQQIVLEYNWLGLTRDEAVPPQRSAFGVVVFNGIDVRIAHNRIQHHEGSGVLTGGRAQGVQLIGNAILANGVAGMPDAVRLEGIVDGAEIRDNLICANDGSGLFLFKPEGATRIQNNDIRFNGRRLARAAVYIMGRGHQILDNAIGYQPGPGVTVAAYPLSDRVLIRNNQFSHLDGLSIDLVAQHNTSVQDFQRGDGPNPPRNSHHRRRDTANGAINAPEFAQYRFERTGETVQLVGQADPGSDIDLYRVTEDTGVYSPLNQPLMTTTAGTDGTFTFVWQAASGDWVSAIASDPRYGTSEPSPVVSVVSQDGTVPVRPTPAPYLPSCFPPVAQSPPPEPAPEPEPLPLRIPRNIHFALDRAEISPESAAILDQIAEVMLTYPSLIVELQGHTDPRASDAYNRALSERRARAARDYLLRQGVPAERMRIVPFGERQRRTQGTTPLDYARDRRVEFVFEETQGLDIRFEEVESDLQIE